MSFSRYVSGQTDRHTRTLIAKLRTLRGRSNNELDGCIMLNTHNTVFGSKRVSCIECTGQVNDFELIPTVKKMETRHPLEGSLVVNFRRSVIIAELWRPEMKKTPKAP